TRWCARCEDRLDVVGGGSGPYKGRVARSFDVPGSRAEVVVKRLDGRVAVITGAGGGIGRETALLFASGGCRIVAADVQDEPGRETVRQVAAAGGKAVYVHADVSRQKDCAAMVASAEREFGKLDVLFNNAGIMHSADDDAVKTE